MNPMVSYDGKRITIVLYKDDKKIILKSPVDNESGWSEEEADYNRWEETTLFDKELEGKNDG